jgi:hypothetical protein
MITRFCVAMPAALTGDPDYVFGEPIITMWVDGTDLDDIVARTGRHVTDQIHRASIRVFLDEASFNSGASPLTRAEVGYEKDGAA